MGHGARPASPHRYDDPRPFPFRPFLARHAAVLPEAAHPIAPGQGGMREEWPVDVKV